MTLKKFSLVFVTFLIGVLCSTFVFAKDDNAILNAGSAITNVTKAHIVYARFKQDVNYKIYFKPSHWDTDNAWFAIHAWNNNVM